MKSILVPILALGLLGAASVSTAADAKVGVVVKIGGGHHHRHHVCGSWGWHHHARFCRRWYWR